MIDVGESGFPPRFSIDNPRFQNLDDSGKVSILGWCLLGRGLQPKKASIRINDVEMAVVDLNQRRPDVLKAYPGYLVDDKIGFHYIIDCVQGNSCKIDVTVVGGGGVSFSFSKNIWFIEKDFAKKNKILSKKIDEKGHLLKYPSNAYVEVTTACNLSCITCFYRDKRHIQHMEKKTFERILRLLSHVKEISLFGYGEPTVHPDYLWMFESVRSVNPTAMISFCSNFNDIDGALMAALVGDAPSAISISLDAATKDTYEKIRKNGSWDKVMDNIRRLQGLKSVANSKYPLIYFSFVVQKYNIKEIADFVRLVNELTHPDNIIFHNILNFPQWEIDYGEHSDILAEALKELRKYNNHITGSGYLLMRRELGIPDEIIEATEQKNDKPYCYDPFQTIVIEVDGSVKTCCNNSMIFGNVLQEDVADIWNSYKVNLFRQMVLDGPVHPECIDCIKACINKSKS